MANETTSKAIEETRATVKDREIIGQVMSLEKNKASDEISALAFKIRTPNNQSRMVESKPIRDQSRMASQILLS